MFFLFQGTKYSYGRAPLNVSSRQACSASVLMLVSDVHAVWRLKHTLESWSPGHRSLLILRVLSIWLSIWFE